DVDWETQTLVTAGAAESLAAAFLGFLQPGDEAILFAPFYDSYAPMVEAAGATPVVLHLTPPDWRVDEKKLRAAITPKTKLIAINSPHNPTGQVITDSELTLLAEVIRAHDLIAVCDEVYEHLIFDGLKHRPLMTLPDMTERCVRIGSAGKTFSMTGWRIGYATGPAHLIEAMAKTHQFLSYTIQPHLQFAVAEGLGFDNSYYNDFVADMQMKRDIMVEGLRGAGFNLSPAQGTYFLTVDIRDVGYDGDDMSFCKKLIAKAGVAAVPISSFYMEDDPDAPKNFARFCFCKQPEVLREASARLKKYFR
ncbi:MAG: aminotransferase class I/II-fold pyridoxal phosphate-dependent enzyme, partial [Aquisalinus sp.]|nr:aminotransferase class I/II-fold pyridoxal phosphate-dependent enzyme [Aquisalinus sp.]